MQKLVLLLGSPIYAISVVLAVLLAATGLGSLLTSSLEALTGLRSRGIVLLGAVSVVVCLHLVITGGTRVLDSAVGWPLWARVGLTGFILCPIGIALGIFYPSGLALVGRISSGAVCWAVGINSAFTVLGSVSSIILAQFLGFEMVLKVGAVVYLVAAGAFWSLSRIDRPSPGS